MPVVSKPVAISQSHPETEGEANSLLDQILSARNKHLEENEKSSLTEQTLKPKVYKALAETARVVKPLSGFNPSPEILPFESRNSQKGSSDFLLRTSILPTSQEKPPSLDSLEISQIMPDVSPSSSDSLEVSQPLSDILPSPKEIRKKSIFRRTNESPFKLPSKSRKVMDFETTMDLTSLLGVKKKKEEERQKDLEETIDLLGLVVNKNLPSEDSDLDSKPIVPSFRKKTTSFSKASIPSFTTPSHKFTSEYLTQALPIGESTISLPISDEKKDSSKSSEQESTVSPTDMKSASLALEQSGLAAASAAVAKESISTETQEQISQHKAKEIPSEPKDAPQILIRMSLDLLNFLEKNASSDEDMRWWNWQGDEITDDLDAVEEDQKQKEVQYLKPEEESVFEKWLSNMTPKTANGKEEPEKETKESKSESKDSKPESKSKFVSSRGAEKKRYEIME